MSDKSRADSKSTDFLPPMDILIPVTFHNIQDIDNMCRLCMSIKETNSNIDMVKVSSTYPYSRTPISELLLDCLNIDINEESSEGMPNTVCLNCLAELHSYTSFKRRSLAVNAKLREMVGKKRKLAEAQALYGPVFFDLESSNQYSDNSPVTPLYFEPSEEPEPDLCMSAIQEEDDEVEPMDLLEVQHSKTSKLPEIGELQPKITEVNSTDVHFPTNRRINVPEVDVNVSEKGTSYRAGSLGPIMSQEGNAIITNVPEVRIGPLNDTVSSRNRNKETSSTDIQVFPSKEGDVCSDIEGDFAIAEVQTDCAAADLPKCSSDIVSQDSVLAQQEVKTDSVKRDVSIQREVEITLCSREVQKSPQKSKKKRRGRKHAVPIPEVLVVEDTPCEKRLVYRCTLCRKVFDSRTLFRKHVVTHFKDKGVVCKHCEKWFKNQSSLARHVRTHSGEKPFLCLLCDRSFSQKEILQRHILTHTDIKPFQCQKCDKSYTQKEGLANHMKQYHETRREIIQYPCPLCDKAFCHPSGLSRHMIMHTGKQYECKVCRRKFTDTSSLRRHLRSQHPEEAAP